MTMFQVKISENTLLDMLESRLEVALNAWGDIKNKDLYMEMYEELVQSGCFEGKEFDPMIIVDNDIINYTKVLEEGDENFNEILKLYEEGENDISCEGLGWNFIEVVSGDKKRILVRH